MKKDIHSTLDGLFHDFNKWVTYADAFALMDAGECSLLNIMDAAHRVGITPGIVHIRRKEYTERAVRFGPGDACKSGGAA
tara:strand:+ start:4040 stop:4279 length:240 start_codon:yes stop_codon:yes gene_type:complete